MAVHRKLPLELQYGGLENQCEDAAGAIVARALQLLQKWRECSTWQSSRSYAQRQHALVQAGEGGYGICVYRLAGPSTVSSTVTEVAQFIAVCRRSKVVSMGTRRH